MRRALVFSGLVHIALLFLLILETSSTSAPPLEFDVEVLMHAPASEFAPEPVETEPVKTEPPPNPSKTEPVETEPTELLHGACRSAASSGRSP